MTETYLQCLPFIQAVKLGMGQNYNNVASVLRALLGLIFALIGFSIARFEGVHTETCMGFLFLLICFLTENFLQNISFNSVVRDMGILGNVSNQCRIYAPTPEASLSATIFAVIACLSSVVYLFYKVNRNTNNMGIETDLFERNAPSDFEYTTMPCDHTECQDMCAICHESLADACSTTVKIACGHVFHLECIRTWIDNSRKGDCPYCRQIVRK